MNDDQYTIDFPTVDSYVNDGGFGGNSRDNELGGTYTTFETPPDAVAAEQQDPTLSETDKKKGPNPGDYIQTPGDLISSAPGNTTAPIDYSNPGSLIESSQRASGGSTNRALTAEEQAFQRANPDGGSFPNLGGGNMTVEQKAFQAANPGGGSFTPDGVRTTPNPGTASPSTPAASAGNPGGNGTLSAEEWAKDFRDKFGFYDDRFNSRDNMLANAQRGDQAIKSQLDYMAGLDADAARVDKAINSHPDFYRSDLASKWEDAHYNQVGQRMEGIRATGYDPLRADGSMGPLGGGGQPQGAQNQLGGMGGQQAPARGGGAAWELPYLEKQQGQRFVGMDDAKAFPDGTKLVGELAQIKGFQVAPDPIDSYGNIVFSDNGQVRHIPMNEWSQWAPVIEARLAAQNAPAAAGNGGGNGFNPRGGGGYNAPRAGGGGGGGGGYTDPYAAERAREANLQLNRSTELNRNNIDYGNTFFMPNPGYDINTGANPVGFELGPNGMSQPISYPPGSAGNPAYPNGSIGPENARYPTTEPYPGTINIPPGMTLEDVLRQRRQGSAGGAGGAGVGAGP